MRTRTVLVLALALLCLSATRIVWHPGLDLQERLAHVRLGKDARGIHVAVVEEGMLVHLSPDEFVGWLWDAQQEQKRNGWLYLLLNITTPWGFLWVAVGFGGQALFTLRMLLQWLASEREGRSVVPVAFWWGSLVGGMMLLVYFAWRRDIVGVVGQSTGVFVYGRNLVLIHRQRLASVPAARGAPGG